MNAPDPVHEFGELYHAIYLRFHRRDRGNAYRLSQQSHGILRHLRDAGPLTVMEAARHFDRSQSAMSELIRRLEKRGLLERMPDERDRRRTLVWLTAVGLKTLTEVEQVLSPRLLEHAFGQLAPEGAERIVSALRELLSTEKDEPGVKDE